MSGSLVCITTVLLKPEKLRRPIARVQNAAGTGMDRLRIQGNGQLFHLRAAPRVKQMNDRRGGLAFAVYSEKAMPESAGTHGSRLPILRF